MILYNCTLGNMHKWAFSPRGCAIFWVHPEMQDRVKPLIVSHNYQKGFQLEFFQQATRDHAPFIIAGAATEYIDRIGGMVRKYLYIYYSRFCII